MPGAYAGAFGSFNRIALALGRFPAQGDRPDECHSSSTPSALSLHELQARFLSILPRIELHGRISFRHLRCADLRADAVAEMVGLAWKWHLRLAERGKDATQFPSTLATFAARAVKTGRRVCGCERSRDVLSPTAQQRHHFAVECLPDFSTLSGGPLVGGVARQHADAAARAGCFQARLSRLG